VLTPGDGLDVVNVCDLLAVILYQLCDSDKNACEHIESVKGRLRVSMSNQMKRAPRGDGSIIC